MEKNDYSGHNSNNCRSVFPYTKATVLIYAKPPTISQMIFFTSAQISVR